ncbi:hypothetical protein C7271_12400 [filamentous cyanobacterium CCP5]|nr:hypothetical protein C7271_12400 [filamentous cyanobacterium CCP5]
MFWLSFLLAIAVGFGLHFSPASAQVAITNQVGAQFTDSNNIPRAVLSNRAFLQPLQQQTPFRIIKTADRAAAEPGDVVVYQLAVINDTATAAAPVTVTDQLPRGMQFLQDSVRSTPSNPTSVQVSGRQITFTFANLGAGQTLTIAYGVLLTPDAVRGSGRNIAQAAAPGFPTVEAAFQVAIRPGIVSDCGTIIGRVFVDKNFDGQQQPGEPGVPNAVVFMDDGNRIITDPEGLFSLANVIAGNRVGTLDLTSLPGYTLAPNLYHISENSQSRLVRLAPGSLARMNFAVTPTFREGQP